MWSAATLDPTCRVGAMAVFSSWGRALPGQHHRGSLPVPCHSQATQAAAEGGFHHATLQLSSGEK